MRYDLSVRPSQLSGTIEVPTSKSQSIRALLFAALANGRSRLYNLLGSDDIEAMTEACRALGAIINKENECWVVDGGKMQAPGRIDARGSGLVLRFIGAIGGLIDGTTVMDGTRELLRRRPVGDLVEGLRHLGASAEMGPDVIPVTISGPIKPGRLDIDGRESQAVSAFLVATSLLEGKSEIVVRNPGETPFVEMTLDWLRRMGVEIECDEYRYYRINGRGYFNSFDYTVSGDFSSAIFPVAAALVTGSEVRLNNLDFDDPQGDKEVLFHLQKMGAEIKIDGRSLTVDGGEIQGGTIDVSAYPDALPALAVIGCFAKGELHLVNAGVARLKECDRISAMVQELGKMGAEIEETNETLTIRPAALRGAVVDGHGDHRVAMALAVAGLGAEGETIVQGADCMGKTYPGFSSAMIEMGGRMKSLDLAAV